MMRVQVVESSRLKDLRSNVRKFEQGHERALNRAVQTATTRSRAQFRKMLSGRAHAPARPDRPTTDGHFAQLIRWDRQVGRAGAMRGAASAGDTFVAFQLEELEGRAPYWLIQEIGTGETATILDRGETRSVKAQRGRLISPNLVWADVAGNYDVPRAPMGQQLRTLQDVKGLPMRMDLEEIRIKKEIDGKHYIRAGGMQANAEYRASLLGLAERLFR